MAKRPAPKKGKPRAAKKAASKPKAKKAEKKPKKPARKSQPTLPGMSHVRYNDLDDICEALAASMKKSNRIAEDIAGYKQAGLDGLKKHDITTYKYAGVAIVRVPGDEKLSARLIKEQGEGGDVGAGVGPASEGGGDGEGAGDDGGDESGDLN